MPTPEEFASFVERREPVVIRGSGLGGEGEDPLHRLLGWETRQWTEEYLSREAGEAIVSVEQRKKWAHEVEGEGVGRQFGFGLDVARKTMHFSEFVSRYFGDDDSSSAAAWDEYLNIQTIRDKNLSMWRYPLSIPSLRDDIPTPEVLWPFVETGDMQDVSLWMGKAQPDRDTFSRLHMDATDNLYVLVRGRKTFRILSPDNAVHMHTVGPTYAVSPNGFSYQMNPVAYSEQMRNFTDIAPECEVMSDHEVELGIDEVGLKNYHFSTATDTASAVRGTCLTACHGL